AVPGVAGALAATFAGGVVLAALRERTGSLAAPVAAHWSFNAMIFASLA
ncbi:MAG: CPBP family glutamic-type intramembrane protease, partial [Candidatus Limnocylindria bacterium]